MKRTKLYLILAGVLGTAVAVPVVAAPSSPDLAGIQAASKIVVASRDDKGHHGKDDRNKKDDSRDKDKGKKDDSPDKDKGKKDDSPDRS
jgi:hypothetical protein